MHFRDFYTNRLLPMSLFSKEHIIPVSIFKKYEMTKWKDISPNIQPVHLKLNQFRRNYTFANWEDHVSSSFRSHYSLSSSSHIHPDILSILYNDFGLESFQFHNNETVALRSKHLQLFMPLYQHKNISHTLIQLKSQYDDWLDFSDVIEHPYLLTKWNS